MSVAKVMKKDTDKNMSIKKLVGEGCMTVAQLWVAAACLLGKLWLGGCLLVGQTVLGLGGCFKVWLAPFA
jgi:hypothetical protein